MQYAEKEKKTSGARALRVALTASALVLTLAVLPNGAAASQTEDVQDDNVVIEGAPNTSGNALPAAQTQGTDQPQQTAAQSDGGNTQTSSTALKTQEPLAEPGSSTQENVITSPQPVDQEGNILTEDMVEVVTPAQQPEEKTGEVTISPELPTDRETVVLRVDLNGEKMFEKTVECSQGNYPVTLSGTGLGTVTYYWDGEVRNTIEVDFS